MCGLTGIIKLEESDTWNSDVNKKIFKELLEVTSLRGRHSTGIFTVPHDKKEKCNLLKRAITASEFVQLDEYEKLMKDFNDYRYLIGHARYATDGVISDSTAHPFVHENIVLVHNGSVQNKHELCQLSDMNGTDCDVDSQALAFALSKNPIEDFVQKIQGAFTIVWYDSNSRKLNFIRNTERPLHFGIVRGSEQHIMFASEAEALYFVARRNRLDLSRIFSLDVGTLLTFNDDYTFDLKKLYDGKKVMPTYASYTWNNRRSCVYNNYYDSSMYDSPKRVDDLFPDEVAKDFPDVDMNKGDHVYFELSDFEQYGKSNRGTLTGLSVSNPKYTVKVYNIPKESLPPGNDLVGRLSVVSTRKKAKTSNLEEIYTLVLDATSIVAKSSPDYFYDEDDEFDMIGELQYMIGDELVSLKTWYEKTQYGCDACQRPISASEDYLTSWTDAGKPICNDCKHTGEFDSHIKVGNKA